MASVFRYVLGTTGENYRAFDIPSDVAFFFFFFFSLNKISTFRVFIRLIFKLPSYFLELPF